jgi:O-antigen/teichoic acid export membrane protein
LSVQLQKYRVSAILARLAPHRTMNLAFVDQVMVSGANFLGGILLARVFGIYEFGRFTLAWMLVEFVGSLQFAAVIQPMLNIGPKQDEAESERYYQAVAAQQGLICALLGVLVWAALALADRLFPVLDLHGLAAPLAAAVVSYQLHNFFRRYFFARDRPFAALCSDALRYAAQIAATLLLFVAAPHARAEAGVWIVAIACVLSAAQGVFFFGRFEWDGRALRDVSARNWTFSKWLLPSALMFWMTSQAFLVMAGIVLGAATTGGLKVAVSITGILNILLLALDNFAPVQASRALYVGGHTELKRYIVRLAWLTGTLTAATVAALSIDPDYIVHLLYGDRYHGIGHLVRWFCAPAAVYGISTVLVIWAAALEWTRAIFISYVAATVFTAVVVYPLIFYGGVAGVVVGSLTVEVIRVVTLLVPLVYKGAAAANAAATSQHGDRLPQDGMPWK